MNRSPRSRTLNGVADYRPPLRDIFFGLDNLVDVHALCELDPFKHIDADTVKAVIEENGRFVSEVVAPTNRTAVIVDPATNGSRFYRLSAP